jgi:hypothetical protein
MLHPMQQAPFDFSRRSSLLSTASLAAPAAAGRPMRSLYAAPVRPLFLNLYSLSQTHGGFRGAC